MRVVSLLPSATEIVFALGHGSELVGRSVDCDFPDAARALPVVMHPRAWDYDAPSSVIDERVRRARSSGESLYELDVERLRELRPDLLLTQDLCGVCSVTEREVGEACQRAGIRPEVVSLTPRTLEEVWRSVDAVGRALGDPAAGARLSRTLRTRSQRQPSPTRPRVAVIEWLDPPILAGLWTPDIVEGAGGQPIGPDAGDPAARTTWPAIVASDVDLLLLSPCSFSVDRSRGELEARPLASLVDGVRASYGTFVADEAYFSRPGPRLADGVELVRSLLARSTGPHPMEVWRAPSPAVGTAE
ncbi:MAG TPA: ABC transporter substrate-binding protein [Thermoplasmata archaeon]|nr:ABC transporter substrate-binding protein [Thermoplasmata archaeon]